MFPSYTIVANCSLDKQLLENRASLSLPSLPSLHSLPFPSLAFLVLKSMLRATRDKAMIDLRHRTRIFVPDASCLLGVVDETGSLPPGQVITPSVGRWRLGIGVGLF